MVGLSTEEGSQGHQTHSGDGLAAEQPAVTTLLALGDQLWPLVSQGAPCR